MKRITCSRKQILRAIHAACVALFFAACAGRAEAAPPFVQQGNIVTTPGADTTYNPSNFTGSGSAYTVTISPETGHTATLINDDSIVTIGGGSITVSSGITIENTASTNGALQINGDGTVSNAGSVSGYYTGVRIVGAGGASSVTNTGSIEAINSGVGVSATGIYLGGTESSYGASNYAVTNSGGTITAQTDDYVGATYVYGVAAYSYDGNISITNNPVNGSGGVITGTGSGYGATVYGIEAASNHDGNVTVNNSGTVVGTVSAVYGVGNSGNAYGVSASSNYGNVSVNNAASGSIEGLDEEGKNGTGEGINAVTDNFGTITISNSGYVKATGTGSGTYSGSADGIYAYSEGGNITITNHSGNLDLITATASGFQDNSAFGIYATDGDFGAIAITNNGMVSASASSVDGSASAYGIHSYSNYDGNVTITNSGSAEGNATPTDGTATGYGIAAGSYYGTVMVTNNGTAAGTATSTDSGSAYAYGVSASSYGGDITITNNMSATGTASANGNDSATGVGLVANSVNGNITVTNNGMAVGSASSYFNGTSATATSFGISASSYFGTTTIINKGIATGTASSAYYAGTGYGIYSSNSNDGNINITNDGEATGEGAATAYSITPSGPTGTGYGIYAFTYNGDGNINITNDGTAYATGTAESGPSSGVGVGDAYGIYAISSSGYISILNNGTEAYGSASGGYSAVGAGVYAYSNSGAITIQNGGYAYGYSYSNAYSLHAYGLYAQTDGPISITNTGMAEASATAGNSSAYGATESAYATGLRARSAGSGNIYIYNGGTASGAASVVYGTGSAYGYGANVVSTGSANITVYNTGRLTGTGSTYAGTVSAGYGVWIGGDAPVTPSGTISITNTITGVMQGAGATTYGTLPTTSIGLRLDAGTGSAYITNSGTVSAEYGVGIYAKHYAGPITLNAIGGAITTTGSGTYSSSYDAVLLGPGNNTVNIVGQSNITGLIDGGSTVTGNTLTLHLAGMTPAQKAALELAVANSQDGAYSGQLFAGGVTYAWDDFENVSGTFVSLEQSVDSGLESLALKIDNLTTPLPVAYGPFYAAAAGNPEAAMNELVGREINQGIDTISVSLNTTLASNLDQHLDNLLTGSQIGGVDLGGIHISDAGSMVAFSDTSSQLDSLLRMTGSSVFGGTEMSTDTKAMVAATPLPSWGVWASGNVSLADDTGTSTLSNFHSTLGSPTLGVDYRVTPNLVLGIMGSYTTGGANFEDGNRIALNAEIGALYGTWRDGNWHVNGIAGGGASQFNDSRATFGGTANSDPGGYDILTDLTGGYDFHLGDNWNITPEAGLQYTHLGIDSFTEGGAGAFDLSEGDQDIDSLRSHVGFNLNKAYRLGPNLTFIPELRAQWYHEFMDNSRGISESLPGAPALGSFDVNTFSPQRDFALVGVGLNTAFTGYKGMPVGLFINYNAQVGQSDYISNSVNAGIRVDF